MGVNDIIKIGNYLKKIRLEHNLTQEQFAEKLNITRTAYANYEKNLREPNKKVLDTISNTFGVDLLELITTENSNINSINPSINTENLFGEFLNSYLKDRADLYGRLLHSSEDDFNYLFNQCFSIINNFYDYKESKKTSYIHSNLKTCNSEESMGCSESDINNLFINNMLDKF